MNQALLLGGPFDGQTIKLKYFTPSIMRQYEKPINKRDIVYRQTTDNGIESQEFIRYLRTKEYRNGKRVYVPERN